MKIKISISMEEATLKQIEARLSDSIYRNKSHFMELAAQKMLREELK